MRARTLGLVADFFVFGRANERNLVAENIRGGGRPLDIPLRGARDPFTADVRVDLNRVGRTIGRRDGDMQVRERDRLLDQVSRLSHNISVPQRSLQTHHPHLNRAQEGCSDINRAGRKDEGALGGRELWGS